MRLYDTYSRSLVELPAPPGPVRMYFCGPTVYARAHIGNARPFVLGMWLRSWLRATGYDAILVHNITDVNDKIYDAAPGASAQLAADATAWYLEDTGGLGLGMPDHLPKVTEHIPGDRALHRGARRARLCLRRRRRRLLPRRALPRVRPALRAASRPGRGAGAEPAQGGRPRLRPLEGDEARRGHALGLAVGQGPARAGTSSARRWRRSCSGRRSRSTAVGSTSSSRTTRTRWRSRGRSGTTFAHDLGAQRAAPVHRRQDVEVDREHRDDPRGARPVGARDRARLLPHRPLAQAGRLLRRDDGAGSRAGGGLPRGVPRRVGAGARGDVGAVRGSARRRLQHARGARGHARAARPRAAAAGARGVRPRLARGAGAGAAGGARAGGAAHGRARGARLRDRRPAARRDRGGGLGDARRARRRTRSFRRR